VAASLTCARVACLYRSALSRRTFCTRASAARIIFIALSSETFCTGHLNNPHRGTRALIPICHCTLKPIVLARAADLPAYLLYIFDV